MTVLQESSPSPSGCCCTPPPGVGAPATPSPPMPPNKKRKNYNYVAKLVLDSIDEILLIFLEVQRKRQCTEEAIEAQRRKKVRTLMSMR